MQQEVAISLNRHAATKKTTPSTPHAIDKRNRTSGGSKCRQLGAGAIMPTMAILVDDAVDGRGEGRQLCSVLLLGMSRL